MEYFAGIDVSLEASSVCLVDSAGKIIPETKAGFDVVLLETHHVKATLSAMIIKTDRKAARGIAQLLRMGWYRSVYSMSVRF